MNVIYQPKGRAREYAPLACNLYMGCTHGCKYCYAPACMHKKPEEWHQAARARGENVLALFERDCVRLAKERAHEMGIYTRVSMEPVIIPDEALEVIRLAHSYVDFWKVGKLNHNKEVERSIDWPKFRDNATALLDSFGSRYYIKEDLRKAM
jgi:DNA repair photolyase